MTKATDKRHRHLMVDTRTDSAAATCRVDSVAFHRNGITGQGFHVVTFTMAPEGRRMLATVFPAPGHVAVLDREKVAEGEIDARSNAWRGDWFEAWLRQQTARYDEQLFPSWKAARGPRE